MSHPRSDQPDPRRARVPTGEPGATPHDDADEPDQPDEADADAPGTTYEPL